MTKKKREEVAKKFEVKKRTPKEKPNFFENVTPFPHPVLEAFNQTGELEKRDTQPTVPNQPNVSNPTNLTKPVAPEKDFTKTANSIVRNAVPERFFKGMSKNTYDALYLKTRGAIIPVRKIRATKSDLIRWTGVSDVTLDKHVRHLKQVGLLKVDFVVGSHEGNWYEVFIPEEIDLPNLPNQPNQDNQPNIPKKVGGDSPNLVGGVGGVELLENKEFTDLPKTLLKTNTIDDDIFIRKLAEATRKKLGRELTKAEKADMPELAEFLVEMLHDAPTEVISSVPKFLKEHLKRISKQKNATSKPAKADTVGRGNVKIKPLTDEERLMQLEIYRERGIDESEKSDFTPDDWAWLIENMENSK